MQIIKAYKQNIISLIQLYNSIQLLNDFEVYIEKYFARICNIN